MPLPGGDTLVLEGDVANAVERPLLEQIVTASLADARARLPLDRVTIIVRFGGSGGVVPEFGFGGQATRRAVTMTIDPTSIFWTASLEPEFYRILLHELHHVARFRAVGFYSHLLDAMIGEGLADQFMVEIHGGDPPPWARALGDPELGQ